MQEIFYDVRMVSPDPGVVGADALLRHIDSEAVAARVATLGTEADRIFLHLRTAHC